MFCDKTYRLWIPAFAGMTADLINLPFMDPRVRGDDDHGRATKECSEAAVSTDKLAQVSDDVRLSIKSSLSRKRESSVLR